MKKSTVGVRAKGERTRQVILDAAEALFAEAGYDAISLRDVAHQGGVLLGLVSYHFTNKEALFEAVASRRAEEINSIRAEQLRLHESPSVKEILEAFIEPAFLRSHEPAWRNYMRVIMQLNYQERWAPLVDRLFRETRLEFFEALVRAMPNASPELLERGFRYVIFVLVGMTQDPELGYNAYAPAEVLKTYRSVIPFLVGGIRAVAAIDFARTPVELAGTKEAARGRPKGRTGAREAGTTKKRAKHDETRAPGGSSAAKESRKKSARIAKHTGSRHSRRKGVE